MLRNLASQPDRDAASTMHDDKTVLMRFRESQPQVLEVAVIIHRTSFAIDDGNTRPIIIGRESPNVEQDVDVNLGTHGGFRLGISRKHVELRVQDNQWLITDLGSRNGTALAGIILEPFVAYPIPSETKIVLGNMPVRLYLD